MRRRQFLGVVGSAAAWPLVARGQEKARVYRIVALLGGSAANADDVNFFGTCRSGNRLVGYWPVSTPSGLI